MAAPKETVSTSALREIPDLGMFMQRIGPLHPEQLASLAQRTRRSFNLIYVFEPGTAHANINKVLDRVRSRYVVIMDDDLVFLTDGWLQKMLDVMQEHEDIGMLVPFEVKDEKDKDAYLADPSTNPNCAAHLERISMRPWCPGYVMMFDLDRLDDLRADESIPGPSGMSDLDLSLQVRSQGFKCACLHDVLVYHPWKPLDRAWRRRWAIVQEEDLNELHQAQCRYMHKKWGSFFLQNRNLQIMEVRA